MQGDWQVFDLFELVDVVKGKEPRLHELLATPNMSLVLYHLPKGSKDMQSPHEEDEVYIVLSGKGYLQIENEKHVVKPGKVLFVKQDTKHTFFDVEEDLTVLALFGPLDVDE